MFPGILMSLLETVERRATEARVYTRGENERVKDTEKGGRYRTQPDVSSRRWVARGLRRARN